jgi:hypothetical protein
VFSDSYKVYKEEEVLMKWFSFLASVLLVLSGTMMGCDQRSDTERALDNLGDAVVETVESVSSDLEDAAEDVAEEFEQ